MDSGRFRINSPTVIHETIDGETVIVNLDSGNYYSLEKVGGDIWALIGSGLHVSEIIENITCRYSGEGEEIGGAIERFLVNLQKEGLIVSGESHGKANEPAGDPDRTQRVEERPEFEIPALHKYSDMQDLLLLDPIHEVDDTGWPNVKSDNV
jgi:hypothetical protein